MTAGELTVRLLAALGTAAIPLLPLLWIRVQQLEQRVEGDPFRSAPPRGPVYPTAPMDAVLDTLDDMAMEGWWMCPEEVRNLTATVRELRGEVEVLKVEQLINESRGAA